LTGYTVVTRDPEFDDGDLERLLALRAYEAGVCACGIHESLAADKSNFFTFENRVCNVCKGLDQYKRVAADEMKRATDLIQDLPPIAPRPTDGRRLYIRQLGPMEVAARRREP
jgi:hypothetical protein